MADRITGRLNDGTVFIHSETGNEGVGHFTTQRRLPEIICKLARLEDKIENGELVEVRRGKIKWVNRPIAAQYATVTNENGEKHYGKVCDRIENNPVGYCGECEKRLDDTFMNFCPNCGAKMDGKGADNAEQN